LRYGNINAYLIFILSFKFQLIFFNDFSQSQVSAEDGDLVKSQCVPQGNQPPPGGVSSIDVNDENVKLFLDEALAEINASEEPDYV
jgi:hypothetical protein